MTAKRAAPDGKSPFGVVIDPFGRRVAIGYFNETPVSILDAKTLTPLAKAQTGDVRNGDLFSVAWSRDGTTLIAGGQAQARFHGRWQNLLRRFDADGRRQGADIAASSDTIMDIRPCGDGFVFAAGEPAFRLLSPQGVATTLQDARTPDMRDKLGPAFAISPDGSSVRFGLGYGEAKPVLFDLAAASLTNSPELPPGIGQLLKSMTSR